MKILKPQYRGKVHDLGYGLQLLVTGVLDPALPQVGNVRARHDAPRRLIDFLTGPPAPIGMAIRLHKLFVFSGDAGHGMSLQISGSLGCIYYTIHHDVELSKRRSLYPLCLWAGTANGVRVTQRGGERQLAALSRLQNQFMAATGRP